MDARSAGSGAGGPVGILLKTGLAGWAAAGGAQARLPREALTGRWHRLGLGSVRLGRGWPGGRGAGADGQV